MKKLHREEILVTQHPYVSNKTLNFPILVPLWCCKYLGKCKSVRGIPAAGHTRPRDIVAQSSIAIPEDSKHAGVLAVEKLW